MYLAKHKLFDAGEFEAALARSDSAVTVFRSALSQGQARLKDFHERGARAHEIVADHAWLVDQIVGTAWTHLRPSHLGGHGIALVAVGGYGRGELHPWSDVDLMILIDARGNADAVEFSETCIRFLWDIGLEVGHSVRTLSDCVEQANANLSVVTHLMEARLLDGDQELFSAMQAATAPPLVWPVPRYFEAKLAEQVQRDLRFEDTGYNLEPNIKESPGGLRDIQMIGWVAQRHFGTRTLKDLIEHRFLTTGEYQSLIRGRNFLWRLRNGLHFITGRREDRLLFDHQRTLADQMGYESRADYLAVEQLMKRYYRTVKEIRLLNEILLQHFQEAILAPQRHRIEAVNERFHSVDGVLEVTSPEIFAKHPSALLELFLILQQHPQITGVRASAIRVLRANLHRIDAAFRRDPVCQSLFLDVFRQPSGLTHALRRMNAYGVLGKYIPAFGRIVGQMQHDLFHVYTVDAHALFVVRNLRRFAMERFRDELPEASSLMGPLLKKERLYLAGLFHDIAKGRGGDHSTLGAADAEAFCRQHGMGAFDSRFVAWLVRHHLQMSWTAQREDISDPAIIRKFAETVGDQERLDNLYLLTIADLRGTSPQVWNAWKGRLLFDLYAATSRMLRLGLSRSTKIEEWVLEVRRDALRHLVAAGVDTTIAERLWDMLDEDYLIRHDPETVAWHAEQIARAGVLDLPLVVARHQAEIDAAQFLVVAPEAEDLLAVTAGGFDRMNLNIVDARIHPSSAGLVLMAFVVLDGGSERSAQIELDQIARALGERLLSSSRDSIPMRTALPRTLKAFPIKPVVNFSAAPNGRYTIMELTAPDRPGLLHRVSRALTDCKVRLLSAKISTFGERAEDVFFITDRDGEPIVDEGIREQLRRCVHAALDAPATDEHAAAAGTGA